MRMWPIEEDARDKLKVVGEERLPGLLRIPATLALLLWAVEDSGEAVGKAGIVADELLARAATSPMAAVRLLANLDGEEETATIPSLADATTQQEIAQAILQLANETVQRYG
jgi:hypothetical protein